MAKNSIKLTTSNPQLNPMYTGFSELWKVDNIKGL